ncbi:MAG: glycosyltransferase family 39 protein, partial [Elusimicrobia bacterium]|nr:glycosyltransferase family 39 protein [Elusimicrobiota bacterium]
MYPAFLALTELPFRDPWPAHPRLALALLSALGVGAAFALGARLGGRAAGWTAALLMSLDAGQVLSAGSLNVHAFYGLVLLGVALAAAAWAEDPAPASGLLLGGALGASLLTRSTHFLAVPLALAAGALRRDGARAALRRAAWPLAGLCAALLPWTARNALQFRVFSPLDAYSGAVNLYAASRGEVRTATVESAVAAAEAEDPGLRAAYDADRAAAYPRLLALARRRIAAAPLA